MQDNKGTKRRKVDSPGEEKPAAKGPAEGYRDRWMAKRPRPNANSWLSGFCSACETDGEGLRASLLLSQWWQYPQTKRVQDRRRTVVLHRYDNSNSSDGKSHGEAVIVMEAMCLCCHAAMQIMRPCPKVFGEHSRGTNRVLCRSQRFSYAWDPACGRFTGHASDSPRRRRTPGFAQNATAARCGASYAASVALASGTRASESAAWGSVVASTTPGQ